MRNWKVVAVMVALMATMGPRRGRSEETLPGWSVKVDPWVLRTLAEKGQAEFLAPLGYTAVYETNAYTRHGEHGNALLTRWPVIRQLKGEDGRGQAARSARTDALRPRVEGAETVARSVCPYCAVGCGQLVFQIESSRVLWCTVCRTTLALECTEIAPWAS